MRTLRLVGLSQDSQQVLYLDDTGVEYAAPADDRLRAALRGDRARLGQLEIEMESALRPRDIQARIRAGEAPEAVAALAGVPVDRIMPYCVPVIAERQHIAELAGRSHVRRQNADSPTRRLADVVAERLRGRGIDPTSASWDAWRRDDGRWVVQAAYHSGERERTAAFVFDAVGRYSLADDDEAKWLTGERQQTSKGPQPREAGRGGERRLAAVPTGEDLLTLSEAELDEVSEVSDDLTAVVRAVREAEVPPESPVSDFGAAELDDETDVDVSDESADAEGDLEPVLARAVNDSAAGTEGPAQPVEQDRRRRPRRASVPSWDEIMLGGRGDR